MEPTSFSVHPSRLAYGQWNETKQRDEGEGDIHASYSADRISTDDSIRKPFRHDGSLWICTSISGKCLSHGGQQEFTAFRVFPKLRFTGVPTTYGEKSSIEDGETARNDPNGFYHGMAVKHARETFVLVGPPALFVAAELVTPEAAVETDAGQMSLF
jgi:hypothetical protein